MKQTKKNEGFTLVEMIVVLVILSALAAMLIPAMLGYIDKAKEKQVVLHAKSVYTAAQSALSEAYAKGLDLGDAMNDVKVAQEIWTIADCDSFEGIVSFTIITGEKAPAKGEKLSKHHESFTVRYVEYVEDDVTEYLTIDAGQTTWNEERPDTVPDGVIIRK